MRVENVNEEVDKAPQIRTQMSDYNDNKGFVNVAQQTYLRELINYSPTNRRVLWHFFCPMEERSSLSLTPSGDEGRRTHVKTILEAPNFIPS